MLTKREILIYLVGFGAGGAFHISALLRNANIKLTPEQEQKFLKSTSKLILLMLHEKYPDESATNDKAFIEITDELEEEKLVEVAYESYQAFIRGIEI